MRFRLEPLLGADRVNELRRDIPWPGPHWQPGAGSAGWHARQVKSNQQLDRSCERHRRWAERIEKALLEHPLVQAAALPVRVHGLLFSHTAAGEGYGRHVDNAFHAGGRADLSFTLFLSDPSEFGGGRLMLESPTAEEGVKLPAGHAIVYPSTQLHRVEPVVSGSRLVAVGWIQSRVRSAERRELLFELDTARRALFQQEGKSEIFDLLCRSYSNLLRMWGE